MSPPASEVKTPAGERRVPGCSRASTIEERGCILIAMSWEIEIPPEVEAAWIERGGPIVKYPDPVLFKVAEPVGKPDKATRALVDRMKAAMKRDNGVGLAAPQLGVSLRVIVYQLPEEDAPFR